jgi:uncharacterized protein involved in outer membrane biogenesis
MAAEGFHDGGIAARGTHLMAWGVAPKVTLAAAGGVALYGALGLFAAPPAIRHLILNEVETRFGREAKVGDISLNPFTMEVEIRDVHIPDADGADAASFKLLAVKLSPTSVLRGGVALGEVKVTGPSLRIERRADGSINLSDFAAADGGDAKPNEMGLPAIWVDKLIVTGGRVDFADLTRPDPLRKTIEGIAFTLTGLSTVGDVIPFDLDAAGDGGEKIAWTGKLQLEPFSSEGEFNLKALSLPALAGWAGGFPTFAITSGKADFEGSYAFRLDATTPSLDVNLKKASITDFALHAEGARTEWIKAKTITLGETKLDLGARDVDIASLDIASPYFYLSREIDGSLNLDMLAPKTTGQVAAIAAPDLPWTLNAPRIRVTGGTADVADRSTGAEAGYRLTEIAIAADGLAFPSAEPLTLDLSAKANDTGRISAKGTIVLDAMTADLAIEAETLDLVPLQPFIAEAANMQVASGALSASGNATFSEKAGLAFKGAASIDGFSATGVATEGELMRWKRFSAEGVRIGAAPFALYIDKASLEEPYARVVVGADSTFNLAQLVREEQGSSSTSSPTPISVGALAIDNGAIDFSDLSVKPHVRLSLQKLSGEIGRLSSNPQARSDVRLTGLVDQYAPASISGRANYLSEDIFADLKLDFDKMQMSTLSPYAGRFAGYELRRGTLKADLRYLVDGGRIDADHHVIINNLQLGERVTSPDALDLPLPLAVALLTDGNGVIDITVPVEGSLDDPDFDLDAVLWKSVGNVITGVVASPFSVLGALSGGGESAGEIAFAPGKSELDEAARTSLARLGQGLAARPGVSLDVPVTFDLERDRAALVAAASLAVPAALAAPAIPTVAPTISDDELEALGQARAAAVQQALLSGGGSIDPGRILIVRQAPVSGEDSSIEMKLAVTR